MSNPSICYIPSSLDRHRLHTLFWCPQEKPRAVVQIVHGMAEHIARYDEFARYLCDNGIAVVGASHLGHGLTASPDELGYFADKNGWEHVVADVHLVRTFATELFPETPYFILGHSMGSFITRHYLTLDCAKGLSGAVISGTADQPMAIVSIGRFLDGLLKLFVGKRKKSRLLNSMSFGSYNKPFKPVVTGCEWLSKNTENVAQYAGDPLCGFCFTVGGFGDLFSGLKYIGNTKNTAKIDKTLPCFFIAGSLDPVGECGKGVKRVYESYRKAGISDVRLKLYEGDRHETLNELDRHTVFADLLSFFNEFIG